MRIRSLALGAIIALALPAMSAAAYAAPAHAIAPVATPSAPAIAVDDFTPDQLCAALPAGEIARGGARFVARTRAVFGSYVAATFIDDRVPKASALVVLRSPGVGANACDGMLLVTLPDRMPRADEIARHGVPPAVADLLAASLLGMDRDSPVLSL